MARRVYTTQEMATYADKAISTVTNWKQRYSDFPKPVEVHGKTELYDSLEFENWYAEHERRKQR